MAIVLEISKNGISWAAVPNPGSANLTVPDGTTSILGRYTEDTIAGCTGPEFTITVAPSNVSYPTNNLVADVPMWDAEISTAGSVALDRSGNNNGIQYNGTLETEGIDIAGTFTPQSWPTLGNEMTFVEVFRYNNTSFTRTYELNGGQNSFFFQESNLVARNNAVGGVQEVEVGFMAKSQPSWYHAHITIIKSDGSIELHRSMLEPTAGWEDNSNSSINHSLMINGNSLDTMKFLSGNSVRHIMLYDAALSGTDLTDLKAYLLAEHRSPHTGGAWPDLNTYTKIDATNLALVTDPEAQARDFEMGASTGGVRLDRTTAETYVDQYGTSTRCLNMPFNSSHSGWVPGQRWMNILSGADGTIDVNNAYTEMIIEFPYCVTDLDLETSLGSKMAPSVSYNNVPPPCVPVPMNEGYISMMLRPPRRNLIAGNTTVNGGVVHGYNYFNGALDPCGQHMHCYNSDGSFFIFEPNTWYLIRHRIKLNDVIMVAGVPTPQPNGVFQIEIDGELKQTDGNIIMRDDAGILLQKLTTEIFSGGNWAWNGSGNVRIGDIKVYLPV